jgi:hypothetical protein
VAPTRFCSQERECCQAGRSFGNAHLRPGFQSEHRRKNSWLTREAVRRQCSSVAPEPNHSSPGGLTQYEGSGSSQFLNTLGRRGNPSVSVKDWARKVVTQANTIAPATMDVINGCISELSFLPPSESRIQFGERKSPRDFITAGPPVDGITANYGID